MGESRIDNQSAWRLYVCLNVEECKQIFPALGSLIGRSLRTLNYYKEIQEGGEATTKQQDKLVEAQDRFETLISVRDSMVEYLRLYDR